MRVVDRATFLNLPNGTVFCKFPSSEGGIDPDPHMMIKVGSLFESNDFIYQSFLPSYEGVEDCGAFFDLMFGMKEGKSSPPVEYDVTERDGLYDAGQKFFVWEKQDMERLLERIQLAFHEGYERS